MDEHPVSEHPGVLPASPAALQMAISGQEMLYRCITVQVLGSCHDCLVQVSYSCSELNILRFVKKELGFVLDRLFLPSSISWVIVYFLSY